MLNLRRSILLGVCAACCLATASVGAEEGQKTVYSDSTMRGNLMRSFTKFASGGAARVAFMGGSVTCRVWRNPVMAWLKEQFPKTDFDFVMAGIGGTDASLGAFRLPSDVFGRGQVDLLFLEFAVNGGGVRPMEGIVRQCRRLNPNIDIMLTYFASTGHVAAANKDQLPNIVKDHEQVAEHYSLPSLYFYRETARRIQAGEFEWKDFSGDSVHPNQFGCDLYSDWYLTFLKTAWADPNVKPETAAMPAPLDPLCYDRGHYVPTSAATIVNGFHEVKGWKTEKTCNFRPPVDVLEATEPGAEFKLDFTGTAVGLYMIAGFDAGTIEFSIDGGEAKKVDLFDHYCTVFHRPVRQVLADDLADGQHQLMVKVTAEKNEKSTGTAIRILELMVNGG